MCDTDHAEKKRNGILYVYLKNMYTSNTSIGWKLQGYFFNITTTLFKRGTTNYITNIALNYIIIYIRFIPIILPFYLNVT